MEVKITLNGKMIKDTVDADMLLIDFCRKHKCYSVKRGCETGNCGLCTVLMDGKPMLSCSIPVGRADGRCVDTLEGLEEEAKKFTGYFDEDKEDALQQKIRTAAAQFTPAELDSAERVLLALEALL